MSKTTLRISFPEANLREATIYAQQLREVILDEFEGVEPVVEPADPNAQSLGTEITWAFAADITMKMVFYAIHRWWPDIADRPKIAIAKDDQPPVLLGENPIDTP